VGIAVAPATVPGRAGTGVGIREDLAGSPRRAEGSEGMEEITGGWANARCGATHSITSMTVPTNGSTNVPTRATPRLGECTVRWGVITPARARHGLCAMRSGSATGPAGSEGGTPLDLRV